MERLLDGERIDFSEVATLQSRAVPDAQLEEKYAAGSVRIVTEQARYPLPQIPSMIRSVDYRLDPEFQRRHRWSAAKKSKLIESFIINVPIPPIFLYEIDYAKYEVMDGLQRLTAIGEFYEDQLVLEGLEEWPELVGRTYSELPEAVRRGIDRRYLSSIVLLQETAKDQDEAQRLKQLVFERLNSGGVRLSDQESRNAIYDGPMNRLCMKLSRHPALCHTWAIPEPDDKELLNNEPRAEVKENKRYREMVDVELVLRFFAYRQRIDNQYGSLKFFLDTYLERANFFDKTVLSNLDDLFCRTISLADDLFGESAFYLLRWRQATGFSWYRRPTTVVYDPLMYVLSRHLDQRETLVERKDSLKHRLEALYKERADEFSGRYTNRENLTTRNRLFDEVVTKTLGE